MKLYKLTDQDWMTRNNTKWGPGVEHRALDGMRPLCTRAWLHAYKDPYIALMMNPVHADITNPVLWLADGDVGMDDGLKVGCTRLRTIQRRPVPKITVVNRVALGIYCALEVYRDPKFIAWANAWLSGENRSWTAAAAEAAEAEAEAWAAAEAAREAEAREAEAAREAARAAARAARAAAKINFSELARKAMRVR